MSWYAIAWSESAPVADAYERAIITLMAHRARKDGTGAYPSVPTMARFAVASERTITRALDRLRDRGVIAEGDQRIAGHIDVRYRPKVYDLLIPAVWFSASQLAEANDERAERGLAPLTENDRPTIQKPDPSRKARSDLGLPKPKKGASTASTAAQDPDDLPEDDPEVQGGLGVTPAEATPNESEVTTSPDQGGLLVQTRGDYKSPNTSKRSIRSEEKNGGETSEEPHPRARASTAAPPPRKPLPGRPETWLCDKHLAKPEPPGADRAPCPPCGRIRRQCVRRQAELDAAAATAAAPTRESCSMCTRDMLGDPDRPTRWLRVDPDTRRPVTPYVICDHVTPADVVLAQIAEAEHADELAREAAAAARTAEVQRRGRGGRPARPGVPGPLRPASRGRRADGSGR